MINIVRDPKYGGDHPMPTTGELKAMIRFLWTEGKEHQRLEFVRLEKISPAAAVCYGMRAIQPLTLS